MTGERLEDGLRYAYDKFGARKHHRDLPLE